MKFTTEGISLCKQVAEKYRRKIECGDWVVINFPRLKETVTLYDTKWSDSETPALYNYSTDEYYKEWFPLWTISDCLEFLKSKSFYGRLSDVGSYYEANYTKTIIGENDIAESIELISGIVKTPLEACLKTVLAVLEEVK